MKAISVGTKKISFVRGDITREKTDAIVNAANSSLMGGGGVDGAIHRAGGPEIVEECKVIVAKQGRLPAGQAVITTGGKLPARYVIHTVGPIWRGGSRDEPATLKNCYTNSLKLADENDLRSVAFPSISTGAYGYPVDAAASVAVNAVKEFLKDAKHVEEVRFVLFDETSYNVYSSQV
jgi:O-acetyl-ADP-ribose deacetylase (regulator of RNase III)